MSKVPSGRSHGGAQADTQAESRRSEQTDARTRTRTPLRRSVARVAAWTVASAEDSVQPCSLPSSHMKACSAAAMILPTNWPAKLKISVIPSVFIGCANWTAKLKIGVMPFVFIGCDTCGDTYTGAPLMYDTHTRGSIEVGGSRPARADEKNNVSSCWIRFHAGSTQTPRNACTHAVGAHAAIGRPTEDDVDWQ